jgi:hypothetical protein
MRWAFDHRPPVTTGANTPPVKIVQCMMSEEQWPAGTG